MKQRAQRLGFRFNIKKNLVHQSQKNKKYQQKIQQNHEQISDNLRKKIHCETIDNEMNFQKYMNYSNKITPSKSQFTAITEQQMYKQTNFKQQNSFDDLEYNQRKLVEIQLNINNVNNVNNVKNDQNIQNNQSQNKLVKYFSSLQSTQTTYPKLSLDPFQQKLTSNLSTLSNLSNFQISLSSRQLIHEKLFGPQQRLLVSIQQKLDNYLFFLKQTRSRKKGEFFSIIRKKFIENNRCFIQFSHLKKIIFLDKSLYSVSKLDNTMNNDCLIDLKVKQKQTDSERKDNFKKKIQDYVLSNKNKQNQDKFSIPEHKFEFEQEFEECKQFLMKSILDQTHDSESFKPKKIDPFFRLYNKQSEIYKQNNRLLNQRIKKVQTYIQNQNQLKYKILQNRMFTACKLNEKQLYKIIDSILLLYLQRNVGTIRMDDVIQVITKKIIISEKMLQDTIQIFIQMSKQMQSESLKPYSSQIKQLRQIKPIRLPNKQYFFESIKHKTGDLLKINRLFANEFKKFITNASKMERFVFERELNDKQKRQNIKSIAVEDNHPQKNQQKNVSKQDKMLQLAQSNQKQFNDVQK